jgi:inner membrane protein involved in colicin E2 resistance
MTHADGAGLMAVCFGVIMSMVVLHAVMASARKLNWYRKAD